jgi:hypothetical protein
LRNIVHIILKLALSVALFSCGTQPPKTCALSAADVSRIVGVYEVRTFNASLASCKSFLQDNSGAAELKILENWNAQAINIQALNIGGKAMQPRNFQKISLPMVSNENVVTFVLSGLPNIEGSAWPREIEIRMDITEQAP